MYKAVRVSTEMCFGLKRSIVLEDVGNNSECNVYSLQADNAICNEWVSVGFAMLIALSWRFNAGINTAGASRKIKRLAHRGLIKQNQLKEGIIISPRYDWPKPDGTLCRYLPLSCAMFLNCASMTFSMCIHSTDLCIRDTLNEFQISR